MLMFNNHNNVLKKEYNQIIIYSYILTSSKYFQNTLIMKKHNI